LVKPSMRRAAATSMSMQRGIYLRCRWN